MKTQPQKNIDPQDARTRLLQAAISLFGEKGYASTSVREIVVKAGVTKPVLYYYFESKEGLFLAILDWAKELQDRILSEVLEKEGNFLERILRFFQITFQGVIEHEELIKMIHGLVWGPPQGIRVYDFVQFHERMIETIETIYLDGVAKGEVDEADSKEVASLVFAIFDFCLNHYLISHDTLDLKRPECLLKLAFHGLKSGRT